MKIVCHILNSLLSSGAEVMLANSAEEWKGYEKHIVCTTSELGNYAKVLEEKGYKIHHIFVKGMWKQHKNIRSFLKKLNPDVVHIHRESQEIYYAIDARMVCDCTIVRTVHSVFKFRGLLRLRRIVTRMIGRMIGVKYIAIGKSVYKNEISNFYNKPFTIIDNWYDIRRYKYSDRNVYKRGRLERGIFDDEFVIVSVGNCSDVKNHTAIIKGIAFLRSKLSNLKIKYIHIGEGADSDKEVCLAEKLNLTEIIEFKSRIEPDSYLQIADLFVMLSKFEGVSIAAIEAMACGLPCLFTDVVGLKDFKELESSVLYYVDLNQNSINEMLLTIANSFRNNQLFHSDSLAEKIIEKYNMQSSVRKYIQVYENN